jgi:hypothetical protein
MNDTTVKDGFVDTILQQIESGDPPMARETYDRLIAAGHPKSQTLHLMAAALRVEMRAMLEDSKPFDNHAYSERLQKLPKI